tara:strand:+ start:67 stop:699 length:633 start_codon:yes stop_codon:yes gene_type:complete
MTFAMPAQLPLFPLGGTILLPGEILPLNVFEPRYLNMVDDAMAGDRMIGVVQTAGGGPADLPALEAIGTAGIITEHSETSDGRYMIVLQGLSRFRLVSELDSLTPYRVGIADFTGFPDDRAEPDTLLTADRDQLISLLQLWFAHEHVETDWDSIAAAPLARVVDRMAMAAPFSGEERQSLLEAQTGLQRLRVMTHILKNRIAEGASGRPN